MRLETKWIVFVLIVLGAACSSSNEETPAATASTGAEAPPAPPPAPMPEPQAAPPAPEPEPAANTAKPEAEHPMPTSAAVVMHQVKDFDAWKKVFDEDQPARKEGSALGEDVMRGVDNPKLVAIYLPTNDIAKLKAFSESKDLKDKMKAGGVIGKPTIYMFNTAGGKMAPPGKATFGAILEIDTKDFAAFKTALEAQEAARETAGILGYGLGQSVDKPNTATLYLQSDDAAKLKTYLAAKETKQAFKDAGAKGALKPTVVQETSMAMY